jgi:hypothetical protein
MTARWTNAHAYIIGDLILPTIDNGHVYYCSVAGTSGATEPTFANRYPGATDGTVTWVPYTVITPSLLRDMMGWDVDTSNQTQPNHTDTVLGNYLLDAIDELEKTTRRYFVDKPGRSWQTTSYGRPILALPGIRTPSSVTWMGAVQTAGTPGAGSGYMLEPDAQQTGVYTSISFRPLRVSDSGPWWLSLGGATTNWFDTGADNPYDPRNYGGGYVFTSTEQDTVIVGDWGYAPGTEPGGFIHALGVLAGFMAMRPTALLADSVITPQGGVMTYAAMPPEVGQFVRDWSAGQQAVSLG